MKRFALLITLVILATPIAAEAPPSVAMLHLFYTGMKARVADEGIRTKFAEIDVAIGEAYREWTQRRSPPSPGQSSGLGPRKRMGSATGR